MKNNIKIFSLILLASESFAATTVHKFHFLVANGKGGGWYPANTSIFVRPNAAPSGQTFSSWTVSPANALPKLQPTVANQTVLTAAEDVTLTALYKALPPPPPPKYSLTVVNGSGSGSYLAKAQVKIQANAAPAGQVFDHWTLNPSSALSGVDTTLSTVNFSMPAVNITALASYKTLVSTIPPYNAVLQTYPDQVAGDPQRSSCNYANASSLPQHLLPVDPVTGWSVVDPSKIPDGASALFVSNSSGNDSNPGTVDLPIQTLKETRKRIDSLFGQGLVPWVFFKRGDSFPTDDGSLNYLALAHTTPTLPMLLSSYGSPVYYSANASDPSHPAGMEMRPRFYVTDATAQSQSTGIQIGAWGSRMAGQYLALVGIEIDGGYHIGAGKGVENGLFIQAVAGFLLEDSYIFGHSSNNIDMDNRPYSAMGLVKIRRSIIGENSNIDEIHGTFSGQGIYIDNAYSFVVEESVFDHAGWGRMANGQDVVGDRTEYRHALYGQGPYAPSGAASGNLEASGGICHTVVKNSIFSNAVDGLDLKDGGDLVNNLIVSNGVGFDYGYRPIGNVVGNVILDGVEMHLGAKPGSEGDQSGMGSFIDTGHSVGKSSRLNVSANIFAHDMTSYQYRSSLMAAFRPLNLIFDWKPDEDNDTSASMTSWWANYPDSISGYMANTLGHGSMTDFISAARSLSRNMTIPDYFDQYSANAVNYYFRNLMEP